MTKHEAAHYAKDLFLDMFPEASARVQDEDVENDFPWGIYRSKGDQSAFAIGETEDDAWIDAMTAPQFGYESAEEFISKLEAK